MGRSDDVISLTREVVSSYETRVKAIGQIVTDTNTLLDDLSKEDVERKKNTAKLLGDFRADHEEMSARLKADLAKVEPELTQAETERVKQAQIEIKERVTSVRELLDEFKTERDKTATAWQGLVNVMQAKRGMAAPPVAEPAKEEAVAKTEPVEMVKAETEASEASGEAGAMAEGESVERTPETAALNDQVLAYLADHPDGTRMTELEEEFGVARIKMARFLKGLMEDNKAEKRDMLYFVI